MEPTMLDNVIVTALMSGGFLGHAIGTARKMDRATPAREPMLTVLAAVLWGDDERWRTMLVVAGLLVVGLTGTTDAVLGMAGVEITATAGKVLIYAPAGYFIDSIAGNLRAVMAAKVGAA